MSDPNRNAAIWYAQDGFDPDAKGINGRRVAGASFLKGFAKHADVSEFVSITFGSGGAKQFAETIKSYGRGIAHRSVYLNAPARITPVATINYPDPNFSEECWRRATVGAGHYSMCGITHTTATKGVMQGLMHLRTAPHTEWDGIICTSRSVLAQITYQLEHIDDYLRHQFGKVPPRFQTTVIPLGINTEDFEHEPKARAALRKTLKLKDDDVLITTLSRLSPHGKFDPFPMFIALQQAHKQMNGKVRLHLAVCGVFPDDYSKNVFKNGAAALMPDVGYTVLDGADATARQQALSGADIFTFPIDNVQETFGLAPIEAMAAGLPLIVSDWDGMKDTVTPDVGIRIPTQTVRGEHTVHDARRYMGGIYSYNQYTNVLSGMTDMDLNAYTQAIVRLATNPELRKSMGAAGKKRAQEVYDWSKVIPQMQDFWAELSSIRQSAVNRPLTPMRTIPVAPPPMDLFQSYPTSQIVSDNPRYVATGMHGTMDVQAMLKLRNYGPIGQQVEPDDRIARVYDIIARNGGASIAELHSETQLPVITLERTVIWLSKFGFVTRA